MTLIALADPGTGLRCARDAQALGVTLIVAAPAPGSYEGIADMALPSGLGADEAASSLTAAAVQILGFETAIRRGKNPDAPVT